MVELGMKPDKLVSGPFNHAGRPAPPDAPLQTPLMIRGPQIRAARALLNVKQSELARSAGVALATLNNIERGVGDPRSSTLAAIERALSEAGIYFEADPERQSVGLRRIERPPTRDPYSAGQRILDLFAPDALVKPDRLLAFARRAQTRGGEGGLRAGFLVEAAGRRLLFDQAEFSTSDSVRVAEIARILITAASMSRDQVWYLDQICADTTIESTLEALRALDSMRGKKLQGLSGFFGLLADWRSEIRPYAEKEGHPLRTLMLLHGE